MCTVSYVPHAVDSFCLTSSRDEMLVRKPASDPDLYEFGTTQILFPKDQEKGGTWVGSSSLKTTLCLLNGAFENHEPCDSYRMSRGQLVLDVFKTQNVLSLLREYNFDGIAPFTLIIIRIKDSIRLHEFRWDGRTTHLIELDGQDTYIWSSCTLYSKEDARKKEHIFQEKVTYDNSFQSVFNLHENGIPGNPNLMRYTQNPAYKTKSITQIVGNKESAVVKHKHLDGNKVSEKVIFYDTIYAE